MDFSSSKRDELIYHYKVNHELVFYLLFTQIMFCLVDIPSFKTLSYFFSYLLSYLLLISSINIQTKISKIEYLIEESNVVCQSVKLFNIHLLILLLVYLTYILTNIDYVFTVIVNDYNSSLFLINITDDSNIDIKTYAIPNIFINIFLTVITCCVSFYPFFLSNKEKIKYLLNLSEKYSQMDNANIEDVKKFMLITYYCIFSLEEKIYSGS